MLLIIAARGGTKLQGYIYSGSNNIDSVAWCWDWMGGYSGTGQTDPKGPTFGTRRLLRGGSFYGYEYYCRVDNRNFINPVNRYSYYGFRCVQD